MNMPLRAKTLKRGNGVTHVWTQLTNVLQVGVGLFVIVHDLRNFNRYPQKAPNGGSKVGSIRDL